MPSLCVRVSAPLVYTILINANVFNVSSVSLPPAPPPPSRAPSCPPVRLQPANLPIAAPRARPALTTAPSPKVRSRAEAQSTSLSRTRTSLSLSTTRQAGGKFFSAGSDGVATIWDAREALACVGTMGSPSKTVVDPAWTGVCFGAC